jgi:hypothetical protein
MLAVEPLIAPPINVPATGKNFSKFATKVFPAIVAPAMPPTPDAIANSRSLSIFQGLYLYFYVFYLSQR